MDTNPMEEEEVARCWCESPSSAVAESTGESSCGDNDDAYLHLPLGMPLRVAAPNHPRGFNSFTPPACQTGSNGIARTKTDAVVFHTTRNGLLQALR